MQEKPIALYANSARADQYLALFNLSREYPLTEDLYNSPLTHTPIRISDLDIVTEQFISLYKGTAIEQIMQAEIAEAVKPELKSEYSSQNSLPEVYRSIRFGLTKEGREYEILAGSPEFRYGRKAENTLQDLVVRIGKYQNPLTVMSPGLQKDTLVSPWVMSNNYGGNFLDIVSRLASNFASAISLPQQSILLSYRQSYGNTVDFHIPLRQILTKQGIRQIDLMRSRNFSTVSIDGVSYAPNDTYYGTKPDIVSSKHRLVQGLYSAFLNRFVDIVRKTQETSTELSVNFLKSMPNVSPREVKMISAITRIIHDTWPATLLIYWRQQVSEPLSILLQDEDFN